MTNIYKHTHNNGSEKKRKRCSLALEVRVKENDIKPMSILKQVKVVLQVPYRNILL